MKEIVDYILEQRFEQNHIKGVHGIFEMAQISDKVDQLPKNTEIWVYSENDEQGTKPPHFHIKIDNRFEFEVKFENFHDLEIWRSKTVKHDWKDYSNVKKAIKKWFPKQNSEMKEYSNIETILRIWNIHNKDHKVDVDKYLNLYNKLK